MALLPGLMESHIQEDFLMEKCMDEGFTNLAMGKPMKETIRTTRKKAMESINLKMELFTKDTSRTICSTGKGFS